MLQPVGKQRGAPTAAARVKGWAPRNVFWMMGYSVPRAASVRLRWKLELPVPGLSASADWNYFATRGAAHPAASRGNPAPSMSVTRAPFAISPGCVPRKRRVGNPAPTRTSAPTAGARPDAVVERLKPSAAFAVGSPSLARNRSPVASRIAPPSRRTLSASPWSSRHGKLRVSTQNQAKPRVSERYTWVYRRSRARTRHDVWLLASTGTSHPCNCVDQALGPEERGRWPGAV